MREISIGKLVGWHFAFVVAFLCFNYFVFVVEFLIFLKPTFYIAGLVIFHIFFIMLLWSMLKSILSDPGRVPIYWGFFLDEKQTKKRRYCLLCHSFKPERCHHCSTCQRCVLNMDHHCPWISNCVGYMNRKFFILFLFYVIITILIALIFMIPLLVFEFIKIANNVGYLLQIHPIVRIVGFLIMFAFQVVISMFFKFHVELVLENSSTIDNLQKARNPQATTHNIYNVGKYENWLQVFGKNIWLWPFPFFGDSGKPAGDGVQWRKNQ